MADNVNSEKPKKVTPDQAAFLDNIYQEYSRSLELYAYRFLNYDQRNIPLIPDAVQDVYLKAVKNVEKLMEHENVLGWLKKAVSIRYCPCCEREGIQKRSYPIP